MTDKLKEAKISEKPSAKESEVSKPKEEVYLILSSNPSFIKKSYSYSFTI
jgi:hypothetical protein